MSYLNILYLKKKPKTNKITIHSLLVITAHLDVMNFLNWNVLLWFYKYPCALNTVNQQVQSAMENFKEKRKKMFYLK